MWFYICSCWCSAKESSWKCRRWKRCRLDRLVRKIPMRSQIVQHSWTHMDIHCSLCAWMCTKSLQLYPTLCDPVDCNPPGRAITLPTKVCLAKPLVFPVVMYGFESSHSLHSSSYWGTDSPWADKTVIIIERKRLIFITSKCEMIIHDNSKQQTGSK